MTALKTRLFLQIALQDYIIASIWNFYISEPVIKDCWVSGIMIDLNGFKQINDNYGHAEGDLALCIVADLLLKSFSEYGVVTRYAGDEFVIMLNTTDDQLIQK